MITSVITILFLLTCLEHCVVTNCCLDFEGPDNREMSRKDSDKASLKSNDRPLLVRQQAIEATPQPNDSIAIVITPEEPVCSIIGSEV